MPNTLALTSSRKQKISLALLILAVALALVFHTAPRFLKAGAMAAAFAADMMMTRNGLFLRLAGGYSLQRAAMMFVDVHLLYMTAFLWQIRHGGLPVAAGGAWPGLFLLLAVQAVLYLLYRKNPARDCGLLVLGMIYGLIIGSLFLVVCLYAFSNGGFALISLAGVISFMISDMVIAMEKIGGFRLHNRDALVWFFYALGQFLLLL